jgi:hypothetical protein
MVIETGVGAQSAGDAAARQWEDGIMEVFFDAGQVISNAPPLWLPACPPGDIPDAALRDLTDAGVGSSDYFIIAFLNYSDAITRGVTPLPTSALLRLYRVSPYRFLVEKSVTAKNGALFDNTATARSMAMKIVPFVRSGL